jgi:hypothetical protein
MIAALLLPLAHGGDADPAQRLTTAGTIEVAAGSAAVVGGLGLMLVGRGPAGETSDEDNTVHDARTVGGAVLVVAGLATVAIGFDSRSRAARMREDEARGATVRIAPLVVREGGGLALDVTF